MCVVVQFYPWFDLYFPLFYTHYQRVPYKKKKKQRKIKIEPRRKWNHNISLILFFFHSISWRRGINSCQGCRNKAFHYDMSHHLLSSSEKRGNVESHEHHLINIDTFATFNECIAFRRFNANYSYITENRNFFSLIDQSGLDYAEAKSTDSNLR